MATFQTGLPASIFETFQGRNGDFYQAKRWGSAGDSSVGFARSFSRLNAGAPTKSLPITSTVTKSLVNYLTKSKSSVIYLNPF